MENVLLLVTVDQALYVMYSITELFANVFLVTKEILHLDVYHLPILVIPILVVSTLCAKSTMATQFVSVRRV